MNLKGQIEKFREEIINQASNSIQNFRKVAAHLNMNETASRLEKIDNSLKSDKFNLIIVGRFKNGKSTIMNALLGRTTHSVYDLESGKGPMPVDDLPCTATLTSIDYSIKPSVKVWKFDNTCEEWSLSKYLLESTLRDDDDENKKFFGDIRQFEVGFPSELCQSGVTMLDSPGTDEDAKRTQVTINAIEKADAAILVYRSDVFGGLGEREFVSQQLPRDKTRIFTLVNLMHGRKVEDRLRGFVWNRLVHEEIGGEKFNGQDFASRDIYFVNAYQAHEGVLTGNAPLIAESGLLAFEQKLGNFLTKEQHLTHVKRFVDIADTTASGILQQIEQRQAALHQDTEALLRAFENIQPQLTAIRARAEKLPNIFDRYSRDCQRELKVSFEGMINQLRYDLPEEIKARPLPSLQNALDVALSPTRQKRLYGEAAELCNKIIKEHIDAWQSRTVPRVLQPLQDRMLDEITSEIVEVERAYNQIHFELTGWTAPTHTQGNLTSVQERILGAAAGLLLGDIALVAAGGGAGVRGIVGAVAGQIAVGVVLGALGITALPVIIPLAIAASIIGSFTGRAIGLEKRLKEKAVEEACRGLQNSATQIAPSIDAETAEAFNKLKSGIMGGAMTVIQEEEQNIYKILEDNQRDQTEKASIVKELQGATQEVMAERKALKEVLTKAQQSM